MKFIKQSARTRPRLSLILVDWSVRESFHLLHYLERQDVERESFEIIVVEYYSRVAEAVRTFERQVDTWLLLEIPENCYYHKHLMYNAGIFFASGEICVICDSDAMVQKGFVRSIITAFENNPEVVLHLDQFRNARRDLYPFRYPSFEEVTAAGCINNASGQTIGVRDGEDPIHNLNYGACMAARRSDLIAIGGADEHLDYLGHICGPYDMTFRLVNLGRQEQWHQREFMYHTWHPGQAGENNYLGPHDGRHMSTTALDALCGGRTMPLVENESIRRLRRGSGSAAGTFQIASGAATAWRTDRLSQCQTRADSGVSPRLWRGFTIERDGDGFVGYPVIARQPALATQRETVEVRAATVAAVRAKLAAAFRISLRVTLPGLVLVSYLIQAGNLAVFVMRGCLRRAIRSVQS